MGYVLGLYGCAQYLLTGIFVTAGSVEFKHVLWSTPLEGGCNGQCFVGVVAVM